jgi:hypothetical protein
MNLRIAALAAFWVAVTGAIAFSSACYTHNCDADVKEYGVDAGEGRMLDENTWESNAVDGPWLPFPRQRFYSFDLHQMGNRIPAIVLPYVSAQSNPKAEGGNFTLGSGNLTEISAADVSHVTIHNGTCADYYLRLVVEAEPLPPAPQQDADIIDSGDAGEGGSP